MSQFVLTLLKPLVSSPELETHPKNPESFTSENEQVEFFLTDCVDPKKKNALQAHTSAAGLGLKTTRPIAD
jgi:hypothetical protein